MSACRKTNFIHGNSILQNTSLCANIRHKGNASTGVKNIYFPLFKLFFLYLFYKFLFFSLFLKKYTFFPFVVLVFSCTASPEQSSSDEAQASPGPSQSGSLSDSDSDSQGEPPQEKKQTRFRGPDKKPRKRGYLHGNFKHGLGKTRGIDTPKYAAWKEGVMQGNDFACFITGEKNKNLLTCHHLNSWDSYPDQRYDIGNGITITKEIHRAFHKEYGAGKNTREQFERFLQEK